MLAQTISALISTADFHTLCVAGELACDQMLQDSPSPLFDYAQVRTDLKKVETPDVVRKLIAEHLPAKAIVDDFAVSETVASECGSVTLTILRQGHDLAIYVYGGTFLIATGADLRDYDSRSNNWAVIDLADETIGKLDLAMAA